jgi:integration host factor subunit alpha
MALTKIDLIEKIYNDIGLSKKESMTIVDSLFEIMKEELAKGNPVNISGFGKWSVLNENARKGRNPKTGKAMTINARKVVTFKGSQVMRKIVNSGL